MLDLRELDTDDMPGMSRVKGNYLAKAAAVCLDHHGHLQGVRLTVQGSFDNSYALAWPEATAQDRRTFADSGEATERGAEGIAILLAIREIGYTVVLRSRKMTGFDYWLGNDDTLNVSDAEREATLEMLPYLEDVNLTVRGRMEVSGIFQDTGYRLRERVNEKLRQTSRSDTLRLPAYVVVVEFSKPVAEVVEK